MTFKTLLTHTLGSNGLRLDTQGNVTVVPELSNYNRADYHPPHGWLHKGGYGSVKAGSALNVLTLLAFLFFLNLLQNCLKENMTTSQPPIVILMSGDNSTDMNGTKVIRTKRGTHENGTNKNDNAEIPTMDFTAKQKANFVSVATMRNNRNNYGYTTYGSPEQQLIHMINNNVNKHWANERKRNNTIRNDNRRGKRRQKSIDQDIYNFFTSFYTDDDANKTNNATTSKPELKQKDTNELDKHKTNENYKDDTKKSDKKDKRINDRVSNLQDHDPNHDDAHIDHDGKDPSLFESLMWKTIESFKPGLRESAEDTVCCKLVACESARLSKKLGGYVKYLMNRYVKRGLEWICKTEEKAMKHAFRIGREGKSCADEIEECKPKNFITDVVLFIDYLIV